eukprot:TRINITY_DN2340_c0_g1_i5.p3 TRINITY_DN2340_c0_g1~~TRINITY_DN2340_c0_g1_i5.p3  ORF type:complete len:438 (+),score=111.84 TRINITY_DN2340_c0_g1_i5:68-1315(+)
MVYSWESFAGAVERLLGGSGFPASTRHCVAVKANPLEYFLRAACEAGMGAECASYGEILMSLRAGFLPGDIVFDSPAKTVTELEFCLTNGIYINADNFQELERIAALVREQGRHFQHPPQVGLRVNPQVGRSTIEAFSTATSTSKFGVPLLECREQIVDAFAANDWLTGLHVHVGSSGVAEDQLQLIVVGVKNIVALAADINRHCSGRRIHVIDIGGGFPINTSSDEVKPDFSELVRRLHEQVPELFTYKLITEYGLSINAKAGAIVSVVEYAKDAGGRRIAVIHAGADLLVDAVFMPGDILARLSVLDNTGAIKTEDTCPVCVHDIAGPLCFSGDLVARERVLPRINAGDLIVIHDSGAYTLGEFSHFNSRSPPPVYCYNARDDRLQLVCDPGIEWALKLFALPAEHERATKAK